MIVVGVTILATMVMVKIPAFEDLRPRQGTLVDASRERFSPCRRGDCTRTMVTVRHPDGEQRYHFADTDIEALDLDAPITVWTHPQLRGFDWLRVWHAEQGGRVIREHASLSTADRRIRLALLALVPVLFVAGGWLVRRGKGSTEVGGRDAGIRSEARSSRPAVRTSRGVARELPHPDAD